MRHHLPNRSTAAGRFHLDFAQQLQRDGWTVEFEAPLIYDGGRIGYIDLVATRNGLRVAFELDKNTPREKSIAKLRKYDCDEAWVVCRNGKTTRIR